MLKVKLLISRVNYRGKAVVFGELIKISTLHIAPERIEGKDFPAYKNF
jgi:hypothetical protein